MQISPPYGYKEVVPYLKTQKVRLLAAGEVPEFVRNGNAIPISLTEFQPVARDYPIVFTGAEGALAPVAVFCVPPPLLPSAPAPIAVLRSPVLFASV